MALRPLWFYRALGDLYTPKFLLFSGMHEGGPERAEYAAMVD